VPLRIVFPIGNAHLAGHALEAGAFALRYFSDYFDIPYPGDKLDMVAIPDFMQGAMENLGCITYRMPDLLIRPGQGLARRDEARRQGRPCTRSLTCGSATSSPWSGGRASG